MNIDKKGENQNQKTPLSEDVERKENLKLRAKSNSGKNAWSGLALFGLVGWSVATPTVAGALLGIWLDKNYPINHSWTLALLVAGLVVGCVWAWHWISREEKEIKMSNKKKDE